MATRSGTNSAVPGSILLAVHDFIARSPDELSLAKGDRIELVERDDDFGDGWFLGKHLVNGNSGLFPEVYTTPAPRGTLNSSSKLRAGDAPVKAAHTAVTALSASPKQHQQQNTTPPSSTNAPSLPSGAVSAQPSLASSMSLRTTAPTVGQRSFTIASDSPVMSETLSVIDEHITDMKSPRASYTNGNKNTGNRRDTMSSVYSTQQPLVRRSYIAGHETDEEEHQWHSEEEVMSWSPTRVAEYLEDNGVEKSHCDVFVEQEISGEVLLAMDQNSLFIKEFELGSVGRRLKTWHKIKALQDEVKRTASPEAERRSVSEYATSVLEREDSNIDAGRNRSSTVGAPSLPRGLTTTMKRASGDSVPARPSTMQTSATPYIAPPTGHNRESVGMSPLQSMTSISRPENSYRPSAQGIRNLNHSRRHSSIDSTSTDGASRVSHRKQPSLDQKWQLGQAAQSRHSHATSMETPMPQRTSKVTAASPDDVDRGYFSSTEVDSRSRRSVLTKRASAAVSPMHSRTSSIVTGVNPYAGRAADAELHQEPVSPVAPTTHHFRAMNAIHNRFGNYRSATTPAAAKPAAANRNQVTPVVTKLEPNGTTPLSAIAASPTKLEENGSEASSEKATPSPSGNFGFFSQAKAKVTGLRSISDAVTKDEKLSSPTKITSPTRTATGSSTPSTENPSLDMSKSEVASRESTGSGNNLMPPPPVTKRPRAKSKKFTSAYTRGLEKKSPSEQIPTCDYSGWMKKKSGSIMASWKPRLFVLKGRRLSYYYSSADTEEKGLIDISFHRVLPAQHETLAGVFATISGAPSSPTSPTRTTFPTNALQDLKDNPPAEADEGLFIFKLVPPKAGLSKGVNFTKPTVHYFAVNSRAEGRLWMAALMKATIDRDNDGVVTTTYNQKTISLAKARARRERPPALREEGVDVPVELDAANDSTSDAGLGIGGLRDEKSSATAGAQQEKQQRPEDASSIVASTVETSQTADTNDSDALNDKEREAVALSGSA